LRRSFSMTDVDGDGLISAQEFYDLVQKLEMPLTELQAKELHCFIDMDKSGQISMNELCCSAQALDKFTIVMSAMDAQAERYNFAGMMYVMKRVNDVLMAPGDPCQKAKKVKDILWDSGTQIVDFTGTIADVTGVAAALYGICQELMNIVPDEGCNLASLQCLDTDLNLAPFVIFVGMSGVHVLKHLAEGQTSDLSAEESLIYSQTFEKQGFTVSQFRKLMDAAHVEKFETDEVLPLTEPSKSLFLISKGQCEFTSTQLAHTGVGQGDFLGESCLLGAQAALQNDKEEQSDTIRCTLPTTVLRWDSEALDQLLDRNDCLKIQVHRAVTLSLADRLLKCMCL